MTSSESSTHHPPIEAQEARDKRPSRSDDLDVLIAQLPQIALAATAASFGLGIVKLYGSFTFLQASLLYLITIDDVLKASLMVSPAAFLGLGIGMAGARLFPRTSNGIVKPKPWQKLQLKVTLAIAAFLLLFTPPHFYYFIALLIIAAILLPGSAPTFRSFDRITLLFVILMVIALVVFLASFSSMLIRYEKTTSTHVICYNDTCNGVILLDSISEGHIVKLTSHNAIAVIPRNQVKSITSLESPSLSPLIDVFGIGEWQKPQWFK